MKRRLSLIVLALVILIQFVPVDRSNPPESAPLQATPAAAAAVLERSCYDCHSNRTEWPWYAHVAPVSWLVAHDVEEGRGHINFSEWGAVPAEKRPFVMEKIVDEVSEGEMPLGIYLALHRNAEVSDADLAALRAWAGASADAGRE